MNWETPKTLKEASDYLVHTYSQDTDIIIVMLALAFASVFTYIVFYTDTPEAFAGALGDLPGDVLEHGIPTA